MFEKKTFFGVFIFLIGACTPSGVVKDESKAPSTRSENTDYRTEAEKKLQPSKQIADKKEFGNGIKIQWFEKGSGEVLSAGDVVEINFKLNLPSGQTVDGNHLLKRDFIPFLVGYNMQTPGMDLAMNELHVGDFVEIYIPGKLARGAKGIPGKVPPNSPNIILMRVGKKINPTKTIDGTKIWCLEQSEIGKNSTITDQSEVAFHYFVGTKSNPRYDNSYQRNQPFSFRMTDNGLVPGLKKALLNTHLYDKLWILVPPSQAYGKNGLVDLVKPNESLFYDILVMDVDRKAQQEN